MNPAIEQMIERYACQTRDDYVSALREILQQIALLGLWRGKFFEHAAFYGGTALRVLYGLDRYSEDLDFSLLKSDPDTKHIPVIMLTAKSEDSDIITGLEIGADDYLAKPFTPKVLIARVRTVLRRKAKANVKETATVRVHDIVIDPGRHEVTVAGEVVDLTLTEFLILHLLARHPGWVFSRYQIVNEIRGEDTIVTDRAVDVQIVGLRRKLGDAGKYVETVRGVGYKLSE